MNKVILSGRLCADPDVRYSDVRGEQMAVASYRLAVNRIKADETDFITCVAFGKAGEFAEKYLKKGTKMLISGRIQTGKYTNQDNQTIYTTNVVVETQEFCESKKNSENNETVEPQGEGPASEGFMTIPENAADDLPFKNKR